MGAVEDLGRKAWWWYWSWGTIWACPSTTELSGDTSAALLSVVSLVPETELALVAADDSVDAGFRDVLAVASDSRLSLFTSCVLELSLTLRSSGSGLMMPLRCGAACKPRPTNGSALSGTWLAVISGMVRMVSCCGCAALSLVYSSTGVWGGGVGASGVFGNSRSVW